MHFGMRFASHNAYRYISLLMAMVVFFADTGIGIKKEVLRNAHERVTKHHRHKEQDKAICVSSHALQV